MNKANLTEMTDSKSSSLIETYLHMSNDEIQKSVKNLSDEELKTLIEAMNEVQTPQWRGKTRSIILGLKNSQQLEVAGKVLSVEQNLDLLDCVPIAYDSNFNKILSILVGMSPKTFAQVLSKMNEDQLQVLLQTSLTEPMQHHLTVLMHEMNHRYHLLVTELESIVQRIEKLSLDDVSRKDLIFLVKSIEEIALQFRSGIDKINKALKISWNSNRLDLIESVTSLKEKYIHTLKNFIGCPQSSGGPTGLYLLFHEQLSVVYANTYEVNISEEVLNEELSTEALIKFSIWYLKDYWEIGLLPRIQSVDSLELDATYSEADRALHRDQLFVEVKNNLDKLHLKTIGDLKMHYIYSKRALKEYIQEYAHLIAPNES